MTVGDKIRLMTDEELVGCGIINKSKYYGKVPAYEYDDFDHTFYGDDREACMQYLSLDVSEVNDKLNIRRGFI